MRRSALIVASVVLLFLWGISMRAMVRTSPRGDAASVVLRTTTVAAARATLREVTAPVVVLRPGSVWEQAGEGEALGVGDIVRTGAGGTVTITISDAGTIRLDEETEITIAAMAPGETRLFQVIGNTYSKVQKFFDPQALYEVETPTAVAAVRGTAFGVLVERAGITSVVVAADVVAVSPVGTVDGMRERLQTVAAVPEGQGTKIDAAVIHRAQEEGVPPPVVPAETLMTAPAKQWFEENKAKDEAPKEVRVQQTLGVATDPGSAAATIASPTLAPTLPASPVGFGESRSDAVPTVVTQAPRQEEPARGGISPVDTPPGNTVVRDLIRGREPAGIDDAPGRKLLEELLPIQSILHPTVSTPQTEEKQEKQDKDEEEEEEKGEKKKKES